MFFEITCRSVLTDKRVPSRLTLMGSKIYALLRSISVPRKPKELNFMEIVNTLHSMWIQNRKLSQKDTSSIKPSRKSRKLLGSTLSRQATNKVSGLRPANLAHIARKPFETGLFVVCIHSQFNASYWLKRC